MTRSRRRRLLRDCDAVYPVRALTAEIAMALVAILDIVVFRLASGRLKQGEAKAGPAELTASTSG